MRSGQKQQQPCRSSSLVLPLLLAKYPADMVFWQPPPASRPLGRTVLSETGRALLLSRALDATSKGEWIHALYMRAVRRVTML